MSHQILRQKFSGLGQTQGYWTFNKYPSEAIHLSSQTAIRLNNIFPDADVTGVKIKEASGVLFEKGLSADAKSYTVIKHFLLA